MLTIKEPIESIAKTWGVQKVKQTSYRLMKYVLKKEMDGGVLLHNFVTGELVLLSDDEAKAIFKLPVSYDGVFDELIAHYFLVPVDFDEKAAVYQLRRLINLFKKKKSITGYTILPTTNCNARCFYCYESDYKHINMSEETADKTVDFIKNNCGGKKVSLSWFGGEPTIGAKIIDRICSKLNEANIEYSSSMISNGYLFDEKMADDAKNLWKLKSIQITLDGTEDTYNKIKAYPGVKGSPYKRVLENIGLLLDREIFVSIRMNLDRHNADDLKNLIGELCDAFGKNENFHAYAYPLFDDCGFDPVEHDEKDRVWLLEKQTELNSLINGKSVYKDKDLRLPYLKTRNCMADNESSVIIAPDGHFTKCEHYCLEPSVGNLNDGITDKDLINDWQATIEYPECDKCVCFPTCVILKGCFSNKKCYEEVRKNKLADFENLIGVAYKKWKENSDKIN